MSTQPKNPVIFLQAAVLPLPAAKTDLSPEYPYPISDILGVTAKVCGLLGLKILF